MNKPLHILVTRPGNAGEALCELLTKQGEMATYFPTITFAPPKDVEGMQAAINQLGEQDWLIFISPQSVYASVPLIRRTWPHFPECLQLAAMGEGTANALKEAGYQAALTPDLVSNSEGLLAAEVLQDLAGKKVAIIRGEGGREILEKTLCERGAQVMHVITYQRLLPEIDPRHCVSGLENQQYDAAICTSFEGVSNLKRLIGNAAWPHLSTLTLLVPSERIKRLAQDLGFQTIWVASNASNQAMINLIAQKKERLCQNKSLKKN